MAGIMDQIANPQMADIAGALDYRQKRLDADEQKRKKIRIGQLVAEATPNLKEGSPLYNLATEAPEQFAVFAKAAGVPLNSGEQMQRLADDTALLYHTAMSGGEEPNAYAAIETAQALKRERNESGQETPQLDRWLQTVGNDPQTAFTALFTMHRSINQDGQGQSKVQSSDILDDGTTVQVLSDGRTRVVDPEGNELEGEKRSEAIKSAQEYGIDLQTRRSEGRTTGSLGAQLELKPQIQEAVKDAENRAKERGEVLTDYGRAEAAMPGLEEVVNKLTTLSDVATYTMGGRAFDTVTKELGFGATEGSTARAKMESLVNNQILPLLRDTFGAQFTEREGEQLRKTMMDINAAPAQKKEILNSFIEQKMRDLEMKRGRAEEMRTDEGVEQQGEGGGQSGGQGGIKFLGFE